ncbi:MAG: TrkA family potassium uptake protein [Ruminococcaceae bacterium]|nr:TrkA family potassium uptake protein [Oscillospiraceae bacterium]
MKLHKSYAVFGLGRYGKAVVRELLENGASVLAVDYNQKTVDALADEIPLVKCADATDPAVIKQLGISEFDVVVIAMAENFEASVMATLLCKEQGVERVIVKCANEAHRAILMKLGADEVVIPESESGIRLAKNLVSSGFVDIAEISEDISVLEISVKKEWVGKTLLELELRKKYNMNVVALKKEGVTDISFRPDTVLESGTQMIVIADKNTLSRMK